MSAQFVSFQIKSSADRARFIEILSTHYKDVDPSVVSALVDSIPNRTKLLQALDQMQMEAVHSSSAGAYVASSAAPAVMSANVAATAAPRQPITGGVSGGDLFGFSSGGGGGNAGTTTSRRISTQPAAASPAAKAPAKSAKGGKSAAVDLDALFGGPPVIPPASKVARRAPSPITVWPAATEETAGPSLYGPPAVEPPAHLNVDTVASPNSRGPSVPQPPPTPSPPRAPDARGNAPPPPPPPQVRVAPHKRGGVLGWLGFGGSSETPKAAEGNTNGTLDDLFVANGAPAGGKKGAAQQRSQTAVSPQASPAGASPPAAQAPAKVAPGLLTPEQIAEMLAMANQNAAAARRGEDDPALARFSERAADAAKAQNAATSPSGSRPAVPTVMPSGSGSKKINPADRPNLFGSGPSTSGPAAGAMLKQFGIEDDAVAAAGKPGPKKAPAAPAAAPRATTSGVDDLLMRFERDGDFNDKKAAAAAAPPASAGSSYDFASTESTGGSRQQKATSSAKKDVSVDDLLSKFM